MNARSSASRISMSHPGTWRPVTCATTPACSPAKPGASSVWNYGSDQQHTPDWFFVSKQPLKDANGRICGTAGVVRRAAEHEMQLPIIQHVARAVEIIRRDFAGPLVLSEVARHCGLSVRHFQRRFQHAFGFSPQEFLMKTRVIAALKLLEETNLSAAEIAVRCGFVDGSSFGEQFRQRVGQSPTAYRQAMRMNG
jgi:AraC-like DNA-binding protein